MKASQWERSVLVCLGLIFLYVMANVGAVFINSVLLCNYGGQIRAITTNNFSYFENYSAKLKQ